MKDELEGFLREQVLTTDVFCFQEADPKFQKYTSEILKDFALFWQEKLFVRDVFFEQTTFVKKSLTSLENLPLMNENENLGLGIATKIKHGGTFINVANVHGISQPPEKLDCPERIEQSKILIEHFRELEGLKIIGGDFNLEPETQSIKMFEENGYRDLIKEFGIKTTRNELSWKNYPKRLYYSDYVFVGPGIKIKNFSVPNMEISDHLPMILEFETY